MGLRLHEGVDAARFTRRTGMTLEASVDATVLQQAIEAGYLTQTADRLTATQDGRLRLDALLPALLR